MTIHAPVTVSIATFAITGLPLPFARVTFEMTAADINGGIVAPAPVTITCDASGVGSASLWPNASGTQGTQYRVTLVTQSGDLQLSGLATVPNSNCNLHEILTTPAPQTVGDAQAAANAAQGYAAAAGSAVADHLADPTAAHAASAISLSAVDGMTSTDVQGGIAELAARPSGGGGGGATNLGITKDATTNTITSDTGTDATLTAADGSNAGLMVPAQVAQLSGLSAALAGKETAGAAAALAGTLGTASTHAATDFATAAQGAKADTAVQPARTVNGHALSADVTVTKDDVGLGNADNTADADKPVSTAQASADAAILSSANAHAESLVVGLIDDRGNFNASGNAFPATGGSGTAGAILKGDLWTVSVAGSLGGHAVTAGDLVRALVDAPGSTDANWAITENNLGYVAENAANKDATGGYAGLTLLKLNLMNALGTVKSWFTTAATVARTWTMPDKDGTVAMTSDIPAFGTTAGTAAQGNDSRLSDSRTPTAHKTSHATGQSDAIAPSDIGAQPHSTALDNVSGVNTGDQDLSALANFSNDVAGSDHLLTRVMLKDTGATYVDKGNSGTSTQTLDYTAGSHQKITTTGNYTIATSNWPPTGNLGQMLLELVNGAANTITWPTVNWVKSDGSFTTTFSSNGVTLQASGTDFVFLWSCDAGTTIYGKITR